MDQAICKMRQPGDVQNETTSDMQNDEETTLLHECWCVAHHDETMQTGASIPLGAGVYQHAYVCISMHRCVHL